MRQMIVAGVCVLAAGVVLAQYPAQPYQIQQGNVLDRNPQLGSGGFNSVAPQFRPNTANRIVTGNVTNGAGFRGFSPISDPRSFGLSNSQLLPSDSLYSFSRDTFSMSDLRAGRVSSYTISPFYSTSSAIVNTGAIVNNLNRPGTSQVQSPYLPPRVDLRAAPSSPLDAAKNTGLLNVSPRVERVDSGEALTGPVNGRLLESPLFGAVRAVPLDQLSADAASDRRLGVSLATPIDSRIEPQSPVDQRLQPDNARPLNANESESPLARLMAADQRLGAADRAAGTAAREAASPQNAVRNERLPDGSIPPTNLTSPSQAADTFAGMREMRGELVRPLQTLRAAPTLTEAAEAQRRQQSKLARSIAPTKETGREVAANAAANPTGQTIEAGPLRTFVGTQKSALNRYLGEAESLIRRGEYYKAADIYDIARPLDMKNPLPLLGRSLALLAAGEYMSSANSLFQAIRTYEALADFPVDLPAFIPDLKMLDRRRADLEQRLERVEDFRLRFLLGYAEYCSGMQKLGMQDMTKAAQAAPPEMDSLRHFVSMMALRPVPPTTRPAR